MRRRTFLEVLGLAAAAPAVVKAESIAPKAEPLGNWLTPPRVGATQLRPKGNTLLHPNVIVREALEAFKENTKVGFYGKCPVTPRPINLADIRLGGYDYGDD